MRIVLNFTKRYLFFIILVIFIAGISGVIAVAPNPGHSWNQMECDSQLCITNNKIGIGTTSPIAKLHVVDNTGVLIGNPSSFDTLKLVAGPGLGGVGGSIVSSGDIEVITSASGDVVLSNGNLLNYKELRFDGANGDLVSNSGVIVADSMRARSNLYSGGANEGNKVCRKDGTNCPPNANPSLSCVTRSGGRGSGPKSVSCQSGETMTGGGCEVFAIIGQSALTQHSYPRLSDTWTCDYGGYESKPYAICCKIT